MVPAIPPPGHPLRRWTARLLDWLLVLVVTSPVWLFAVGHVKHEIVLHTGGVVDEGVEGVFTGDFGALGDGAQEELVDLWGVAALTIAATVLVQVLALALYETIMHRYLGRTLGKMLLSVRLVGVGPRLTLGRAFGRSVLTTVIPGAGWALLLAGAVWLNVWLIVSGCALLVFSIVECLLLKQNTTWHDRCTGTAVVRMTYREQLQPLEQAGRRMRDEWHKRS